MEKYGIQFGKYENDIIEIFRYNMERKIAHNTYKCVSLTCFFPN